MAIAFIVGSAVTGLDNTTTATSLQLSVPVAIGDCVVVCVGRAGAFAIGTVTDNASGGSNTYTQQSYYATTAPWAAIYTCIATKAATTITINFTAGSKTSAVAGRYSGVGSIGANKGTNHNASVSPETITCTLANAANWAVSVLCNSNVSTTAGTSSGNLRANAKASTGAPTIQTTLNDNTGALSVVNAATCAASATWSCAYCELVPSGPQSYTLTCTPSSFSESGTNTPLKFAARLSASAGSFSETGTSVTLKEARKLSATPSSFVETGTAAGIKAALHLAASSGTFSESGTAVTLKRGLHLSASGATYAITGVDVTLTKSSGTQSYVLTALTAAFNEVAPSVLLKRAVKFTTINASFAVAGTAARLKSAWKLSTAAGSFAETAPAAALKRQLLLTTSSGSFAEVASDVTFSVGHAFVLYADTTSFALSAAEAAFVLSLVQRTPINSAPGWNRLAILTGIPACEPSIRAGQAFDTLAVHAEPGFTKPRG